MIEKVYGLIGEKLGHTLSPFIHTEALKLLDLNGVYNVYEVPKGTLKEFINSKCNSEVLGFNVTIPYKTEVMNLIDKVSEEAQFIGAVNTLKFENGGLKGYNTDYFGFIYMLKKYKIFIKNKTIIVLGSGGASKAVIKALLDMKAKEIRVISRKKRVNEDNNSNILYGTYEERNIFLKADIIINCTPCGMYPDIFDTPIEEEMINNFECAIDLIYNPQKTKFLEIAKKKNIVIINGLYMLVAQALKSQSIWNNIELEEKLIDKIYLKLKKSLDNKDV